MRQAYLGAITFRRLKSSAPRDVSPQMSQHAHGCETCAAIARDIDTVELRLEDAVRVKVPDGMADAIILRHRRSAWLARLRQWLQSGDPAKSLSRGWSWAVAGSAASAVIIAVIAALLVQGDRDLLADKMIAHVVSEPGIFAAQGNIDAAQLQQAVAQYGASVHQPIGIIRHLGDCVIDGVVAKHILVQTPYGMATLILLPEQASGSSHPRTNHGYTAVMVPLRKGTLGIIADSPDRALQLEAYLMQRMTWVG